MEITPGIVLDAVEDQIGLWGEVTRACINQATLPKLPENNNLLKAALWFNFGLEAGQNLMPAVAFIAGKAALPLWIVATAQKQYKNHFAKKRQDAQEMLGDTYQTYKNVLVDSVSESQFRFTRSSYYDLIESTFLSFYQGQNIGANAKLKDEIGDIIRDSGVILTKQNELAPIINRHMQRLATNLTRVWEGAQSGDLLYVAKNSELLLPTSKAPRLESCRRIARHSPFEIPDGYIRVNAADDAEMAWLYANAHALKTTRIDYGFWEPCLDTTYAKPLPPGQQTIEQQLNNSYRKTCDLLAQTHSRMHA